MIRFVRIQGNQQSELQRELNEVVSGTSQFRESERQQKLVRLPTGDGMALVLRDSRVRIKGSANLLGWEPQSVHANTFLSTHLMSSGSKNLLTQAPVLSSAFGVLFGGPMSGSRTDRKL